MRINDISRLESFDDLGGNLSGHGVAGTRWPQARSLASGVQPNSSASLTTIIVASRYCRHGGAVSMFSFWPSIM
jgi:hypothetical protein